MPRDMTPPNGMTPRRLGMPRKKGILLRTVALGAVVATVVSGCGTGGEGDGTGKKGGTLHVLMQSDFEHLDPQRSYAGVSLSVGRLLYPALTAYKNAPGKAGHEIVGDAATDTGKPNATATEWTFNLRPDLKWQDGKPVTCADFKYGLERSFSDSIDNGPPYAKQWLVGGDKYVGPYKDPKGLPSIVCAGNAITYKLNRPVADFAFAATLPVFSAVRKDKDTQAKYDSAVFSYGPYQIETYKRDQRLKLIRNKSYKQESDKLRKNLPDVWDFNLGIEQSDVTERLIQDRGDDQAAISLGVQMSPQQLIQVQSDEKIKKRSISGLDGFTFYLSLNNTKIKDQKCRQAYTYLIDKKGYLTALGGKAVGEYAQSILPPTLTAHKAIDPYGLKSKPEGDVAKAKALLAQSPSCPRNITFDYRTGNAPDDKSAAAIKAGFARGGVNVTLNPIVRAQYITTVGKPSVQHEMSINSWFADWPSGAATIPAMFDGRNITPSGNDNRAQLNNPAINAAIDAASKEPDFAKAQKMWGDIDEMVQQQAAVVPLRYVKNLTVSGSKVTGAFLDAQYSDTNLCNLGVSG